MFGSRPLLGGPPRRKACVDALLGKNIHGSVPVGSSHTSGDNEISGIPATSDGPRRLALHLY
jgi:hypothetical protein